MYRDLNDYELLYMVCENNDNDFNMLLKKYKPLINKIVRNYEKYFRKFGYEIDDLMQIGYITLYKTSRKYDTYNQSTFYTYFRASLIKNITSIIKNNSTNRKQVLNNALSYNVEFKDGISYLDLISDKTNDRDNSNNLIIFKNSMPIYLSWVFELFYNGYSREEISLLLDEDLSVIRKYFYKIKEHALTYKYLFFT